MGMYPDIVAVPVPVAIKNHRSSMIFLWRSSNPDIIAVLSSMIFKNHRSSMIFLLGEAPTQKCRVPKFCLLQNYSPRLGTVIFEAFSLRKRDSMRYMTRQQFQEKKRKKNIQYCFNNDKT